MKSWIFCALLGLGLLASAGAREIFIESDGADLFCRVVGEGKPLVVIHGSGLSQEYLLPHLYPLADDRLVIFYDQRGCGQSTGEINAGSINLPNLIVDIERIRESLHLDKISLLGHSWGGFLAMHYAIAHPESVEKLILSNSLPASSEQRALYLEEYKKRTGPHQQELSAMSATFEFQAGDPKTTERFYQTIFQTYCFHPQNVGLLNLRMTPAVSIRGGKVYQVIRETIFKDPYNLHAALCALNIPTLVIHGDFDPMPPITAQKIHESIAGSQFVLLKECGHFPFVEKTEEYLNFVNEFLRD